MKTTRLYLLLVFLAFSLFSCVTNKSNYTIKNVELALDSVEKAKKVDMTFTMKIDLNNDLLKEIT